MSSSSVFLPKILLQGDSLTQLCWEGWGAHLANVYQRRADVVSRGYGGYNTRFYLRLPIDTTLANPQTTIVLTILFLGANDQAMPGLDDHKHVPVQEYQSNLKILVDRIRSKYGCSKILLIGPPPVHHGQRLAYQIQRYGKEGATGKLERTLETAKTYSDACQAVAKAAELPFLNLYQGMLDEGGDDYGKYFYDGLHFSSTGHDFVGHAVVEAIAKAYPELSVQPDGKTGQYCNSSSHCPALTRYAPYHDEINVPDIDKAFETMIAEGDDKDETDQKNTATASKKRKELEE